MTSAFTQLDFSVRRWSAPRLLIGIAGSLLIWSVIAAACMCVGSNDDFGWPSVIFTRNIRLETLLVSSLVGASLAAAGVVYQAILRNPLADPYLLGVSGGASLCAYVWRLPLAGALGGSIFLVMSQQAFAFVGAMIVVTIVLVLATRQGRLEPVTLLLVGVIMNAIDGAIFLMIDAIKPAAAGTAGGAISFIVGGIQQNITHGQEIAAATVVGIGWIFLLYLAGQLNVAAMPEAESQALGVQIHRLRWVGLIAASTITAAAVSISGPIGFVGLICPHVARRLVGSDNRNLLPWSTALGAALLCVADAGSRLLSRPDLLGTHLPVGVLMALLGGPFFLLLLWERRRSG